MLSGAPAPQLERNLQATVRIPHAAMKPNTIKQTNKQMNKQEKHFKTFIVCQALC